MHVFLVSIYIAQINMLYIVYDSLSRPASWGGGGQSVQKGPKCSEESVNRRDRS
jgi:hypothetical protein